MRQITENAWLLALGNANAVLLRQDNELTLVDAGFPGKQQVVLDAIASLGKRPSDLRHLVFTHGHPDHIGSAAALVRMTGARTYMHAIDAPLAEGGGPFRPMTPGRGLMQKIGFRFFWNPAERMEPFGIDQHIADGETLQCAGGLQAVHVPGHCAGQLAFLWQGSRLLIAGDVFTNLLGLGDPVGFEDQKEGRRSQRKLAGLTFDAAVFGHGKAITRDAVIRFQRAIA